MPKPILLTGMRPTFHLHVGNYFGALKPMVELQKRFKTYLMIADIHALTTLEDTKSVRESTLQVAMLYLAAGIDAKSVTLFVQSRVPEHAELATLFSMVTPISMLELNPVYKEMLAEHPRATNLGLLAYPVLQAADILAYKATVIPVGTDQLPHLELTREIARRFNARYGTTFPEPLSVKPRHDLKILSLQDPTKKMSKSHPEQTQIGLLDAPEAIRKKIKAAVTDSSKEVTYDPVARPGISNLITLLHLASRKSIGDIEKHFAGTGYAKFKIDVADALVGLLKPVRERYLKLSKNKKTVERLLIKESSEAQKVAQKTLKEAKAKIGLV